ncbi:hypothetical protein OPFAMLBM_00287 [Aeromonas phage avDM12-TAAL]|nr:hypothetical protein OPFAMLBM_00287 [Aeromonas phage avDM12-TAAL]
MKSDFADKFTRLTRELAFELKEMNLMRCGAVDFEEFDVQYQKVVEKFNEIRELLRTLPCPDNNQSLTTYLTGISQYLGTYIRCAKNKNGFYQYFDNMEDPYERSIHLFTEMVRSAGRNSKDY